MKPILVANSLAITVFVVRAAFVAKAFLFPDIFAWEYKALMFGQNTALVNPTPQEAVITTVIPAALAWVVGFLFASIYNYLAKRN